MGALVAIFAALAIAFGGSPAPAVDPVPSAPAVSLDAPVDPPVDPVMEADAYATYDFLKLHPNVDEPLKLEYVMTVDWDTEDLKRGEFVLASRVYPGKFHVMRYSRIYFA